MKKDLRKSQDEVVDKKNELVLQKGLLEKLKKENTMLKRKVEQYRKLAIANQATTAEDTDDPKTGDRTA